MQIVWCGCRLLDVIHGVQLGYYGIFKDIPNDFPEDMDDFENIEHENHM